MPAYTVSIVVRRCGRCNAKATKEVFNDVNASCGYFCAKHAKAMVLEINHIPKGRKQDSE